MRVFNDLDKKYHFMKEFRYLEVVGESVWVPRWISYQRTNLEVAKIHRGNERDRYPGQGGCWPKRNDF